MTSPAPDSRSTVYVETTVIGHLVGRIVLDPIVAGRQTVTRQWWRDASDKHRLFVSQLVADECSDGDSTVAGERLAAIEPLEFLRGSELADTLTRRLIEKFAVPANQPRDAAHISIAAVNRVEYLVTWNFKHIANPATRSLIEKICLEEGHMPPKICTPDQFVEMEDVS